MVSGRTHPAPPLGRHEALYGLSSFRRCTIRRIFACDGGKNHHSSRRQRGTGPMVYCFQMTGLSGSKYQAPSLSAKRAISSCRLSYSSLSIASHQSSNCGPAQNRGHSHVERSPRAPLGPIIFFLSHSTRVVEGYLVAVSGLGTREGRPKGEKGYRTGIVVKHLWMFVHVLRHDQHSRFSGKSFGDTDAHIS